MALIFFHFADGMITHWKSGIHIGMTDNVNLKDKNDLNVFPFLLLCRLTDAQTEFLDRI